LLLRTVETTDLTPSAHRGGGDGLASPQRTVHRAQVRGVAPVHPGNPVREEDGAHLGAEREALEELEPKTKAGTCGEAKACVSEGGWAQAAVLARILWLELDARRSGSDEPLKDEFEAVRSAQRGHRTSCEDRLRADEQDRLREQLRRVLLHIDPQVVLEVGSKSASSGTPVMRDAGE
jgi:hypothetical protein